MYRVKKRVSKMLINSIRIVFVLLIIGIQLACSDAAQKTNPTSDLVAPKIMSSQPNDNARLVPKNALVSVVFNESISQSTVTPDNVQVVQRNEANPQQDRALPGAIAYNDQSHTIIFTPSEQFVEDTSYTVIIRDGITDVAGNPLEAEYQILFTTSSNIDDVPATGGVSVPGGTYDEPKTIVLSCSDAGCSGCQGIYFTLDGSQPTLQSTAYTGPIQIASNTTLRFFAVDSSGNSEPVQTIKYIINTTGPTTVASPAGGTFGLPQTVTLQCQVNGAPGNCTSIFYTVDGSEPTTASPQFTAGTPITVNANTTIKYFGVDGQGNQEPVRSVSFVIDTVKPTTVARPAGGNFTTIQTVSLDCSDGNGSGCRSIYYTLDGSNPTQESQQFGTPIDLTKDVTIKFFAVDLLGNQEPVKTQTYSINANQPLTRASPGGAIFPNPQQISLSCVSSSNDQQCTTYYTLDGTAPTVNSTVYTGPIDIDKNTTIKYFSTDSNGVPEPVQTVSYAIDPTILPAVLSVIENVLLTE